MNIAAPTPANRTQRWAVIATAFAFLITMMGTTLPTPLYALYAEQLDFTPLTVTALFAVYAIGVVVTLLLFGRLSDELGRRPVLAAAVTFALISALLFLLPTRLETLIIARVVSGLGAGLMSGAGTAALMDLFAPEKRGTAGALAITVNTGGLAIGTLFAGVLADTIAMPLVAPFIAHLALSAVALVGLFVFTPAPERIGRFTVRPQRLRVPAHIKGAFTRGVLAAGAGFAVCGVLTAVSALFLTRELMLDSRALAGGVVFLAFASMAAGQLIAKRVTPQRALPIASAGLTVASAFLAWALAGVALTPLLISAVVLGVSAGVCLNAGLATTVEQVEAHQRGEVSSSFFAGLYTMLAVPAIGVGFLTNAIGLRPAGLIFAGAIAVLATIIAIATFAARDRR
ncbi:MFS transporter [Leucobacter sp. UCMA 4100]|uniref:MFS transporter n=1 Tax=Leucobacter sp. UCMA 4100 TaxID=2810534 RepID=UPI0022EA6870|nr:MFS transporter [Leucobacter sp. UCMA 4100]MDA3147607.1 MFS transporter [Leucobacter sp. UCMA 4100]